jgi:L-threonylcarbamoyladenylate synthase
MTLDQELEQAKALLQAGGVVALPTETVYGLAASIFSEEGLRKIFAIKERPFFDPLIVHISDLEQKAQVISEWPPLADFLAEIFWPGPLTLVLPKHPSLNPLITAGLETVGLRMPAHEMARQLIDKCGFPLAAPSANKFGKTSPTKAEHVRKGFERESFLILDGGQSEVGLESTVVALSQSLEGDREIVTILRPGAITADIIENALKDRGRAFEIRKGASQASPGHTEHHYMPNVPLVIVEQEGITLRQDIRDRICQDFEFERAAPCAELRLDPNPRIAARSLYVRMREGTDTGASFLFVLRRRSQQGGIWDAIWDRLNRASSRTYQGK